MGDGMQQGGITPGENLALILRYFFDIGSKVVMQRIDALRGVDKELANTRNIAAAGPPSRLHLFQQETFGTLGMNGGENGLAAADVVV